jgi:hypothetical protein
MDLTKGCQDWRAANCPVISGHSAGMERKLKVFPLSSLVIDSEFGDRSDRHPEKGGWSGVTENSRYDSPVLFWITFLLTHTHNIAHSHAKCVSDIWICPKCPNVRRRSGPHVSDSTIKTESICSRIIADFLGFCSRIPE